MKNTTEITADEQRAYQQAYQKAYRLKNKELNKEYQKAWYQKNKEEICARKKEYNKEYRATITKRYRAKKESIDPSFFVSKQKAYRLKNKELNKEYQKAWYQKNKEEICARKKEYNKEYRDKIKEYHKEYRAKKESIDPSFFVSKQKAYRLKNKESLKMKRKMKRDKVKFSSQEQTSSMKNKPKKLVCDMCENKIEDYAIWEAQQLAEWGFYMHIVIDADYENSPSGFNAHTHGMNHLNHPDFQITISIGQDVISAIFHNLCAKVKKGMRFKDGDILDNVIGGGFKVRLSTATECGNEVLRVILPDLNGNILPTDIDNNYGSAQYDNFSSQD